MNNQQVVAAKVRTQCDALRTEGVGGEVLLSREVTALGPKLCSELIIKVSEYNDFNDTPNPFFQERSHGTLKFEGLDIVWKVLCYKDGYKERAIVDVGKAAQRVLKISTSKEFRRAPH